MQALLMGGNNLTASNEGRSQHPLLHDFHATTTSMQNESNLTISMIQVMRHINVAMAWCVVSTLHASTAAPGNKFGSTIGLQLQPMRILDQLEWLQQEAFRTNSSSPLNKYGQLMRSLVTMQSMVTVSSLVHQRGKNLYLTKLFFQ
jgi:hypothetical protein